MAWILAHFALSTGVEKDAIEEDKAFSHVAKIRFSWDAIVDWLRFEIWSPTHNTFPRYEYFIESQFRGFSPKYLTPQERQNPPLPTRFSWVLGTSGQNGIALRHQWTNAANIGYKASNINFFPIFCNVDLLAHCGVRTHSLRRIILEGEENEASHFGRWILKGVLLGQFLFDVGGLDN